MAKGNSGTIIVSIVSVAILGVAGYFIFKALKKPTTDKKDGSKDEGTTSEPSTITPTQPLSTSSVNNDAFFSGFTFPIRKTQSGSNVKKLQELILTIDKNAIPKGATGYFGSETESALQKYLGKKKVESQADVDVLRKLALGKLGATISTGFILGKI